MKIIFSAIAAVFALVFLASPAQALTDAEVRQILIDVSLTEAHKTLTCACPYDKTKAGSLCGGTSAYSKPGGTPVLCYPADVTDAMVAAWRLAHPEPAPIPEPAPAPTVPGQVLAASYTTPAAAAWQQSAAGIGLAYPAHWDMSGLANQILGNQPRPAERWMGLQPKVEQVRDGKVVATYTQIGGTYNVACNVDNRAGNPGTPASVACGPFAYNAPAAWKQGDVFRVYPAVYKESLYLGPARPGKTTAAPLLSMRDITIEGVTQDVGGVPTRPVIQYDDVGGEYNSFNGQGKGMLLLLGGGTTDAVIENLTIKNIDVRMASPPAGRYPWQGAPKALIYIGHQLAGATTFEDMRITGSQYANGGGGNGVLSGNITETSWNSGEIKFTRVEMGWNGGPDGPAHNLYWGECKCTLTLTDSYLHDVPLGHLWKSRAPRNNVIGNLVEGGPQQYANGFTLAESHGISLSAGGMAVVRDNVFVKDTSGSGSNAMSFAYGDGIVKSGVPDNSLVLENNTFVDLAATYDGAHRPIPVAMFGNNNGTTSWSLPGDPWFAPTSWSVANNVFIGYAPRSLSLKYENFPWNGPQPSGTGPQLVADFSDLNRDFSLRTNYTAADGKTFGARGFDSAGTPLPPVGPQIDIEAQDVHLAVGQPVKLVWTATGANSCSNWAGPVAKSGNVTVSPLETTEYKFACAGPTGTTERGVTLVVYPPPIVGLTADPATIAKGGSATLKWATEYSSWCARSDGWVGSLIAPAGAIVVKPVATTTYTLLCSGEGGKSIPVSATVTVAP